MGKIVIGKEEWCALPQLGLPAVKARIDSGAKTSSLHAFNLRSFEENGEKYVNFDIHPVQDNRRMIRNCRALVVDERSVKSSTGEKERRHVIRTDVALGGQTWEIEVTLTNRDSMGYRMLLGREAMEGRLLIDPEASFRLGRRSEEEASSLYEECRLPTNGMKVALLASNPCLYSNKRLMEAGEQRGYDMRFLNIRHCYITIGEDGAAVHYRGGEALDGVDAVIPRIKPSVTFYGCAVTRQFHSAGAFCLNDAVSISRSRDKLRALQVLANSGVAMPMTGFAGSPLDTEELIRKVGGAPLVMKLLEGTQGKGVVLAETNKAAESVINAFKSLRANILVQEFVKEANGRDIRCFVIDGKVAGAMERRAAAGEFRANLHLGGTASAVRISREERRIAVKAAKAMGLLVAGVDIIRSSSGPKVLEINSSPGLEGIEAATGKDLAGLMIDCIERHVRSERGGRNAALQ
jgi:ribosomal protein S6--L-glutamate ligase